MNEQSKRYLAELAADIREHGNPDGDLLAEMQAAHERRQTFAQEMATGHSTRAKQARIALATKVWLNVTTQHAVERLDYNCGEVAA